MGSCGGRLRARGGRGIGEGTRARWQCRSPCCPLQVACARVRGPAVTGSRGTPTPTHRAGSCCARRCASTGPPGRAQRAAMAWSTPALSAAKPWPYTAPAHRTSCQAVSLTTSRGISPQRQASCRQWLLLRVPCKLHSVQSSVPQGCATQGKVVRAAMGWQERKRKGKGWRTAIQEQGSVRWLRAVENGTRRCRLRRGGSPGRRAAPFCTSGCHRRLGPSTWSRPARPIPCIPCTASRKQQEEGVEASPRRRR